MSTEPADTVVNRTATLTGVTVVLDRPMRMMDTIDKLDSDRPVRIMCLDPIDDGTSSAVPFIIIGMVATLVFITLSYLRFLYTIVGE